ncbi:phosphatase PAP2 family protein [Prosthecochloris sp. ZM_2]|uniref:phosphatase PAP2 family protein n=1 Tax=Prosthecochloris sp. ZM_2 TaxID=2045206 RepID=UPI000F0950F3|nr:phosphatase PAP2 family protein [Prosthecochloris sp. ZM_2]RNA64165.1 phosphatase PAP2 family protein [Prosthecochloris sp. ZM_2]
MVGFGKRYNSFPNGHASVGFFMIFPYFLYRNRHRLVALTWLGGGMAYGTLMGVGRMAQGGHFASDTLWAAAFICLSGVMLCHWLDICNGEGSR